MCEDKRRPDSSTVPGTARNHQPQNPAWPWGQLFFLTSQKPKKDEEDRHFFSLVMKKNNTQ